MNLNPISGVITVKQAGGDNFDRELIARHYLTVEARDDLGKGNRNTVQLIINIEDVNDNAPMFLANRYEARLLENEKQFENNLVLEARDIDLNGSFFNVGYLVWIVALLWMEDKTQVPLVVFGVLVAIRMNMTCSVLISLY